MSPWLGTCSMLQSLLRDAPEGAEIPTCGAWLDCSVLLTELPARKAAGFRPGAADAKSTDMDAGEPGSEWPMSMMMLCSDTCVHSAASAIMRFQPKTRQRCASDVVVLKGFQGDFI